MEEAIKKAEEPPPEKSEPSDMSDGEDFKIPDLNNP